LVLIPTLSTSFMLVIAINELSIRLQKALHNNNLSGISLGIGAPPIHSLLFADDLILCGKDTLDEAQAIKTILYKFCQQSGRRLTFKNPPFISAGMSLTISRIKSKVYFLFPIFRPTLCT